MSGPLNGLCAALLRVLGGVVGVFSLQILGSGMSNKMWENVVEHAKTCVLNGKLYVYYADEKQNIGVIFNNIFQLMGLVADSQYMSVDALSESEKVWRLAPDPASSLGPFLCFGARGSWLATGCSRLRACLGTWGPYGVMCDS